MAMETVKKTIAVYIVLMLTIGFNVIPAEAYTELRSAVQVPANATVLGVTLTFIVDVVNQGTTPGTPITGGITFPVNPNGVVNSGKALKIKGASNELNVRIIIYTDNNNNNVLPNKIPNIDPATGVDGSGMVGQTDNGYVVPLIWGAKSYADNDPNQNTVYGGFTVANLSAGIHAVYIVDTRHTHSFTGTSDVPYAANPAPFNTAAGMDANAMYTLAGAVVDNPASPAGMPGLYPQVWSADYYDKINTDPNRKVVSPTLYNTIGTVAFNLGNDGTNYICRVPKLPTAITTDNVGAKLGVGANDGVYIPIGGDFRGAPAQVYSTAQLNIAIVQN